MSTRYATIITADEGHEVISNIAQIEGAAPRVRSGTVEPVADAVQVGMIRGGKKLAVGEWGFDDGAAVEPRRAAKPAKDEATAPRSADAKLSGLAKARAAKAAKQAAAKQEPKQEGQPPSEQSNA